MIESVRLRLALWHTAALSILLLVFALGMYGYLARSTLQRSDLQLAEAARAYAVELRAELGDEEAGWGAVRETAQNFRLGDTRILVFGPTGQLLAASPVSAGRARADPRAVARALARSGEGTPALMTLPDPEGGYRVYSTTLSVARGPLRVVAVASLHERQESLEGVRSILALAIPLALLLAGAGGYLLARRSLAPVLVMSDRAERIGAANLHERLPVPNPRDELGHLAGAFNRLLDRMGNAIEQQRRFMADAAHELRTPVAILRSEADVALTRDDRSSGQYRDSLVVVRDEGRRLSRVVDDLFLLARADAGEHPLRLAELYLNDLVEECVRATRSLAAARQIDLRADTAADAPFLGDEFHLHRLVLNLLDNAIKYSPPGSRVLVSLRREGDRYRLAVRDTGPSIAPELRDRIFERFFRSEAARGADDSGAGLGLAIARWVADAHRGSLDLLPAGAEAGNEFVLWLPVTAHPTPLPCVAPSDTRG